MSLSYCHYPLRLKHTFTTAHGSSDARGLVFVRFERDGMVGWGEASPNPRYGETPETCVVALRALAAELPEEPLAYGPAIERLRAWPGGDFAARAALEAAILDWAGRRLGQPVHRLWGLDPNLAPPTNLTIGMDRPEVMAEHAAAARDFATLKIKLGSSDDRAMIRAIRRAAGQPLRVDANEGWRDRERAAREIEWLAGQGVELVEQPLPADRLEDAAWLKARSPLPLIADEAFTHARDIPELRQAYHGVNVKLAKLGGLTAAREAVALARLYGMRVFLGCMVSSTLGAAADVQLASLVDYVDLDGFLLAAENPFDGPRLVQGRVLPGDGPGLGVAARAGMAPTPLVS